MTPQEQSALEGGAPKARKPYRAPRLRRHGTVEKLTRVKPSFIPTDSAMSMSDRAAKADLAPADAAAVLAAVLALPVNSWRYRDEEPQTRHLGPTAQDFAGAFGLGSDARLIANVDAQGVALAAIQAIHALVVDRDRDIALLRAEVASLRRLVAPPDAAAGGTPS